MDEAGGRPWAVAQQALRDDPQKDAQRTVQRGGGQASVGGLNVFMPMGRESSEDAVKRVLPVLQETARAMRNLTL